jgi:hypothetical protein
MYAHFLLDLDMASNKFSEKFKSGLQKVEQSIEPSKEINKKLDLVETASHPIYWDDLEACSLRRFLPNILQSQHFEIIFPEKVLPQTKTASIFSVTNAPTAACLGL